MPGANPLFTPEDRRWLEEHPWLAGVEWYREIDSTNRRAAECCGTVGTPHLVVAERQTAGRGRGENRWWSGDGCLMFSLVLRPADFGISRPRFSLLSLATGLAVAQQLTDYVDPSLVGLKWPNDVLLAGRKVCGILLEVHDVRAPSPCVVVGVGINVSNHSAGAPDQLPETATSLREHAEMTPTLREVLGGLLRQIEVEFGRLGRDTLDLRNRWGLCCRLTGQTVQVRQPRGVIEGVCEGVDADGALLLLTAQGRVRCVSGESRLVKQ